MSAWNWVTQMLEGGGAGIGSLLSAFGGTLGGIGDPKVRRQVAFSMALIALSAKMAKADGVVTSPRSPRSAPISPCRRARNAKLPACSISPSATSPATAPTRAASPRSTATTAAALEDVLDGLFAIAKADGTVHEAEFEYLREVASIFGFTGPAFERIALRHVVPEEGDPYLVLGAARPWTYERLRARSLAAENHPDRLIGARASAGGLCPSPTTAWRRSTAHGNASNESADGQPERTISARRGVNHASEYVPGGLRSSSRRFRDHGLDLRRGSRRRKTALPIPDAVGADSDEGQYVEDGRMIAEAHRLRFAGR